MDNRVSNIDSANRFSKEDVNTRIEGLRTELYSFNFERKESPVKVMPEIKYSKSPSIQVQTQTQFNKNVMIIMLGLLKHVF